MAISNYETKLQKGSGTPLTYADVADVVSVNPPSIENGGALESTSQASGGHRTYIPKNLTGLSEFTVVVDYVAGDTLAAAVDTLDHYRIAFPNGITWTFDAVLNKFSPAEASADSPEVLRAELSFQPSGECVIAPVV